MLSPVKLARARTVQKLPRPSRLAESARRQATRVDSDTASTPAAATPAAPTPLGETQRPNVEAEQLVTPQPTKDAQSLTGTPVSPGAQASPTATLRSNRIVADPLSGAICPEVEGRIMCVMAAEAP